MAIQLNSAGVIVIHYNVPGTGKWMIQSSTDLSNWQPYNKAITGSGSTTIPTKSSVKPGFFRLISVD